MRVLIVHNRYRSTLPSGENDVVDQDIELLREAGVKVELYLQDSDEIEQYGFLQKAELLTRPIYSLRDANAFRSRLRSFSPDVIHLHNPYPLISPGVIRVAKAEGIPVVQTVHNYRLVCANGLYFRDGNVCQDCLGKRIPWPSVVHRCYRDSLPQSLIMATSMSVNRSTWNMVDRYLPVSEFVAEQLRIAGVPDERIRVRVNTTPDPGEPAPLGDGLLFVGRLADEKGISLLLEAWSQAGVSDFATLTIAGDGPQRESVERAARDDPSIHVLGLVASDRVGQLIDECALCVVPSLCFEAAAPLSALQSFARGRSVISLKIGALAKVVNDQSGWICAPPYRDELASAIRLALGNRQELEARGAAARHLYEQSYGPRIAIQDLLEIYSEFI